jgi:hypothetical protein
MFQTASGHALVALGILAQELLREEISQDKGVTCYFSMYLFTEKWWLNLFIGLTLTPAQAQLGPQWTDVVNHNVATKIPKSTLGKRRRPSNVSRQDDDESDASAEGPSVETRSFLSVSADVSDESDVF